MYGRTSWLDADSNLRSLKSEELDFARPPTIDEFLPHGLYNLSEPDSTDLDSYRVSPTAPRLSSAPSPSTKEHKSLQTAETSPPSIQSIFEEWSGRGRHVEFLPHETIELKQGRFLGHGSMGSVYETTVRGHAFAWKRRFCRRSIAIVFLSQCFCFGNIPSRCSGRMYMITLAAIGCFFIFLSPDQLCTVPSE